MSRRARERHVARDAEDSLREMEEARRRYIDQYGDRPVRHFEGSCDVCGGAIALDWHPADGIIDYDIDDDGRMFTWVRHYATAPPGADPRCAVYSSVVREVGR
jgi:hypothetical protein